MGIEDIPELYIGLVLSCYSVGFVLGMRICFWFVDRVGHIRSFAALAAMASCAALMHLVFESSIARAILRVVTGFCTAALYTIAGSWINAKVPNDIRGRVLSLYMVTSFIVLGAGQLLLNLSAPIPDPGERLGVFALMRISPLGVALCFSAGAINAAFFNLGPLFAQKSGFDTGQVSTFMVAAILAGPLVQWPVGWLSDRFDRR